MKNNVGIFDAKELASYIKNYYGNNITPIKLQKSLYFCFAYWGSFARLNKEQEVEMKIDESDYLFDNRIEAWIYGPVIPDVYNAEKNDSLCDFNKNLFSGHQIVKEYIDGVLNELKDVSDFKLVSISHSDDCWKDNFDLKSKKHHKEINKEEIINEYIRNIKQV